MLTLILDIVPILIFIMWFIWLYTRNVLGMRSVLAGAASLLATFLAFPFSGVLHGAIVYSPGLAVTLVLGVFHAREQRAARFTLLAAAGVYLVALLFRTIDNEVCPVLPIGTHFLWHLLIGLVTYLAMRSLILGDATEVRARVR